MKLKTRIEVAIDLIESIMDSIEGGVIFIICLLTLPIWFVPWRIFKLMRQEQK